MIKKGDFMRVIKNYDKISENYVKRFQGISTATIYESSLLKKALQSDIKPINNEMKLIGTAVTVETTPRDNLTIHEAIYHCKQGDVLVIDVCDYTEAGYWGEIMTRAALEVGIKGIVINGGVRDAKESEKLKFDVFCKNVCIKSAYKNNLGKINHPIYIGGISINPGDLIIGDRDGVVVVSKDNVKETWENSQKRIEKEKRIKELLKEKSTIEIYSFEEKIKNMEE